MKEMFYLDYAVFLDLYRDALTYSDQDRYTTERGWQTWMDGYSFDTVVEILQKIFWIANTDLKELRNSISVSQKKFSESYGINQRTYERYESSERTPSTATLTMIKYIYFLRNMNEVN